MKFCEIKKEYKKCFKNGDKFLVKISILYYMFALLKVYDAYSSNSNIIESIIKWGIIYYFVLIFAILPLTLLLQWGLYELINLKKKH